MKTLLFVLLGAIVPSVVAVQFFALRRERAAAVNSPPTGRMIDVDGVHIHAVQAGQGPDLVLLHGASGSTRDFTFAFADLLKDRYRITMLDRPGLGWSEQIDPARLVQRPCQPARPGPSAQGRE